MWRSGGAAVAEAPRRVISMRPYFSIAALLAALAVAPACAQCQREKHVDPAAIPDAYMGFSVAASGPLVAIGEWRNIGGAVFIVDTRTGQRIRVKPDDVVIGDSFGYDLDLEGDRLLVSRMYGGSVDVLERSETGQWSTTAILARADDEFDNFFGWSVALSGDVAIAGAPEDDSGGPRRGSVYLYERAAGGAWNQVSELLSSDGLPVSRFGDEVAIDGDVLVVGAPNASLFGTASGAAYVFERDDAGVWVETTRLIQDSPAGLDQFGTAVAVCGYTIMVGLQDDDNGVRGAVCVFEKQADGTWIQTQRLHSSESDIADLFGEAIGLSGELAVIGARYHGPQRISSAGAAYIFTRGADGLWTETAKLTASDAQQGDEFGYAVAVSGRTAVIGAWHDDDIASNAGSAYIFAVGPDADGNGLMDVCECIGDTNGDYVVSLVDLSVQLAHYGKPGGATRGEGDFDADGDVDLTDVASLLTHFGEECW